MDLGDEHRGGLDLLLHLPCSKILQYEKRTVIYNQDEYAPNLYWIIEGVVKVCRANELGCQVIVDLYGPDEVFGEMVFLPTAYKGEYGLPALPSFHFLPVFRGVAPFRRRRARHSAHGWTAYF
jgi:CRP-like cAMP-binding protein